MQKIKNKGFLFWCLFISSILWQQLLLQGCNGIERRKTDLTIKKKLLPIQNAFQYNKILDRKITHLNPGYTLNSAILLSSDQHALFTTDVFGNIIAHDLNGQFLWKKLLPDDNKIIAGPVYNKGKILVASDNAKLFCLDSATAQILWQTELSSNSVAKPTISDNMVFVHTLDGGLTALSLINGKQLWRISTVIPSLTLHRSSSPVVSNSYIIIGFANGKLFNLNKDSGEVLWSYNISHPKGKLDLERISDIVADPIINNGIVYAISYQGNLVAIKLEDGKVIWEKELSSYAGMELKQQTLFITAKSGEILSIDINTGNILWIQKELEGRMLSKPIKYEGYLILGDHDGCLHILDPSTGFIKGRILLNHAGISITPQINANNQLQILTDDGYLVILKINN